MKLAGSAVVMQFRAGPMGAFTALLAAVVASPPPPGGSALAADSPPPIVVELDQAKLVSLPKGRHRIILGDPIVVRVTPLPNGTAAVLTGTAYGETNMIVLDERGGVVMEAMIRVAPPSGPGAVVQRGPERATYDCAPRCEPRMQLGDTGKDAEGPGAQIQARNGAATSQPGGPTPRSGGGL